MIHWSATLPHAEPEDDYSILSLREFLSAILLTFALLYVVAMLEIVSLKERSQVTRTAILSTLQGELRRSGVDVGVTPQGEMVLPDRVFFDHGRHELKPEGAARLQQIMPIFTEVIFAKPEFAREVQRVVVEGHTSQSGDYDTNMSLSLQRAGSVLLYIAGMNALPHREALLARLTGAGRGKSDARAGAEDEADRNVLIRLQFQSDDELLKRLVGQFGGGG